MMCRVAALLCLICVIALAKPFSLNTIPEQFKDILPDEVKEFYATLTPEDKTILKEVAEQHDTFENEDQALEALKVKSDKLYNKANELRTLIKTKIESLEPEAKSFVEEAIDKLRGLRPKKGEKPNLKQLKEVGVGIYGKYEALSESAKTNIKNTFPKLTNFIQNEKVQKAVKTFIGPIEKN